MEAGHDVRASLAAAGLAGVSSSELIRDSPGRPVWRVGLSDGTSLIVKHVTSDDHRLWRLVQRDGRALRAAAGSGVTPDLVALDDERRVMAQTDLGVGRSLADHLLGEDSTSAETALVAYAESLARLHNATAGVTALDRSGRLFSTFEDVFDRMRPGLTRLGVAIGDACDTEVSHLSRTTSAAGEWDALVHGDACPDNTVIGEDGAVAFFDFEHGGRTHCLFDLTYLHLPFPSCWCVGRIPARVVDRAEAAYRKLRPTLCGDEAEYARHLAKVAAVGSFVSVAWHLDTILEEDHDWGTASIRQRPPVRLSSFASLAERAGALPALADLSRDIVSRLDDRWPDLQPLVVYPAFAAE